MTPELRTCCFFATFLLISGGGLAQVRRDDTAGRAEKRVQRPPSPPTTEAPEPIRSSDDPRFAETEEGCADGRVQDYLRRHGDGGVIDPEVLLEMTRREQREREIERRAHVAAIGGTVWTSLGPTNGAGRATAVATHPTTPGLAIIGAAGGGAWGTSNSGLSWTPLTDSIPNLSVGAIAYAPSNPSVVYLGTGEGGTAIDFIPGIGLLYSMDTGSTWNLPSSVVATQFYKISVNPTNSGDLVIATNAGALRSTNGPIGPFTTVIARDSAAGVTGYGHVTDLVRDPTDAQILYAATWDTGYWCQSRSCGNPYNYASPTILKSIDDGQTWTPANSGLPVSSSSQRVGRFSIAIAPSSPQTLYAAVPIFAAATATESSHIYKSTNGGTTWTETSLSANGNTMISNYLSGQGWYDNTIVVSPTDPNTVLAGGVFYVKSIDGGTTWVRPTFTGSSPHVDAHDLRYDAAGTLYIANDGGIWTSPNSGDSAVNRSYYLVTRQYYALANDPANPNRILGGTQDNGTNRRTDAGGTIWDYFTGGDGMECGVNANAPSIAWSTFQYAALSRTMNVAATTPEIVGISPVYESSDYTPFLSSLVVDPNHPSTIYTATHRVWRSTTGGDTWVPLPTTTTDGSVWSTGSIVTAMTIAPGDSQVIMVAKSSSVFRSVDGGATWIKVTSGLPSKSVNSIAIDPNNSSIAYVALAGMSGISVYMTPNGGSSWISRGSGLPAFSALVVRVDPTDSTTLYCGTDVGVYRSTDAGGSWWRFGTGLPAVSVYDIQILADGSIVRAGTHGRGVWDLTVTGPTNTRPAASISSPTSPQTIARGTSVTFSGTTSDADVGDGLSTVWTFPDTWASIPAPSGASSVVHKFDRSGRFPVTLAVKDSHGGVGAAVVDVTVPEPADDCASPIVIPPSGPFPWSAVIETSGATKQGSDPASGGSCYPYTLYSSVWMSFTPAVAGTYQFSTSGSAIGAVLIGYTGPACGPYVATTLCHADASSAMDYASDPVTSIVLAAGVPIRLLVADYYSARGAIIVTVTQNSDFTTTVRSVSPTTGPVSGGTTVTIVGSGFASGATVSFGGTPATGVTVVTPSIITASTPAHSAAAVDVTVTSGGHSGMSSQAFVYQSSPLAAPTGLVATGLDGTSAGLTWNAVSGADGYDIARRQSDGTYSVIGSSVTTSFTQSGLTPGTAYVYEVRASASGGVSALSEPDIALTATFTNDPFVAGSTVIRALHLTEIRNGVNAARIAAGLTPVTFTDPTPAGVVIRALHIEELRSALAPARSALHLPVVAFAHGTLTNTSLVTAADFEELRLGVK